MWEISYLISKTATARKLKIYKHLDGSSAPFGNDNFFRKGESLGCSPPSVNLGRLMSRFLFVDNFASNYFNVFFILAFLRHVCCHGHESRSKRHSQLCEGQPSFHNALRCCLVQIVVQPRWHPRVISIENMLSVVQN